MNEQNLEKHVRNTIRREKYTCKNIPKKPVDQGKAAVIGYISGHISYNDRESMNKWVDTRTWKKLYSLAT